MAKKTDDKYQEHWREAFDWLSACCDAATSAECEFRNIFKSVVERGIAEKKKKQLDLGPEVVSLAQVLFRPTDEERKAMRDAYNEWQAYKLIWEEKEEELKYLETHGEPLKRDIKTNKLLSDSKFNIEKNIAKIIFYLLVITSCITIITKLTF